MPPLFLLKKTDDLFLLTVTDIDFTRVSPPVQCDPALFLLVRPHLSTILCKFTRKFFSFGYHPLEGVIRGVSPEGVPPIPLVTPLGRWVYRANRGNSAIMGTSLRYYDGHGSDMYIVTA